MKKLSILLICLILVGCVPNDYANINNDLDNYLSKLDTTFKVRSNHTAYYYDYYLPSDTYDDGGNTNSSYFTYHDAKIVMNLNIPYIVNAESFGINEFYDEGFFKDSLLDYSKSGSFVKNDSSNGLYQLNIYKNGSEYLIHLVTNELNFYGLAKDYDVLETVKHLFIIGKSVNVNSQAVVSDYSNKDVIEYVKQQVNLFEYDIPSSGFLSDIVDQKNEPTIETTDNIEEEQESEPEEDIDEVLED